MSGSGFSHKARLQKVHENLVRCFAPAAIPRCRFASAIHRPVWLGRMTRAHSPTLTTVIFQPTECLCGYALSPPPTLLLSCLCHLFTHESSPDRGATRASTSQSTPPSGAPRLSMPARHTSTAPSRQQSSPASSLCAPADRGRGRLASSSEHGRRKADA